MKPKQQSVKKVECYTKNNIGVCFCNKKSCQTKNYDLPKDFKIYKVIISKSPLPKPKLRKKI